MPVWCIYHPLKNRRNINSSSPLELQNQFASFVEEIDKSRLRELLAIKHIKLLLNDSWLYFISCDYMSMYQ